MTGLDALIIGSTPAPDPRGRYAALIGSAAYLIAADGGAELCLSLGRAPDLCVGDFDSVAPDVLAEVARRGSRILRFPVAKDSSDLDLAVRAAREHGVTSLSIGAAFSGRMDHTLAAVGTLLDAADLDARATEPAWTAYPLDAAVRPRCELELEGGTIFSVLSLRSDTRVSVSGAQYELDIDELSLLASRGVSNIARLPRQSIVVHAGAALVIVNEDG